LTDSTMNQPVTITLSDRVIICDPTYGLQQSKDLNILPGTYLIMAPFKPLESGEYQDGSVIKWQEVITHLTLIHSSCFPDQLPMMEEAGEFDMDSGLAGVFDASLWDMGIRQAVSLEFSNGHAGHSRWGLLDCGRGVVIESGDREGSCLLNVGYRGNLVVAMDLVF